MTTVKVKYRPSVHPDRKGAIFFQITHDRKVRQFNTEYRIFNDEWDATRSRPILRCVSVGKTAVTTVSELIRRDIERLTRIVGRFEARGLPYTADDVIDGFKRYMREYSLGGYMESLIENLRRNGKTRTSETYTAALNSFRTFQSQHGCGDIGLTAGDLMLDCLTSEVMEAYEAWHKARGNTPNTISFYTRILRAVYNRAVVGGIIADRNPFRRVYTGIDKTVKRALPLEVIRKIRTLDLSSTPRLDHARDMFLMSFYLRGMSFIDMAFLKKSDLRNGYVTYRRRKTGQRLTIAWTHEMGMVLDKYPDNPTRYLLPIITTVGRNERWAYRNVGYNINRSLKVIAAMVGVEIPLTMYVARHSWASVAKSKGIPLSVISQGMGHDSEATTQIYLASLDASVVDKANAAIIGSL
ncbi:MAG: site-specific integrase [Pseudoflavonifractor sp.]|nr:site-specific integrase [Pseudoflavonifractor sp.]